MAARMAAASLLPKACCCRARSATHLAVATATLIQVQTPILYHRKIAGPVSEHATANATAGRRAPMKNKPNSVGSVPCSRSAKA